MRFRHALIISAAILLGGGGAAAVADYLYNDSNGPHTVLSFVQSGTDKLLSSFILIDSTGTEKATAGNPVRTDPTGTTAQPVTVGGNLPAFSSPPHVVCDSGCSGGSTASGDSADGLASQSSGLAQEQSYPFLWNGSTFDRWYGDHTNGGWVNVKTSVLPTNASQETGGNLATIATNTAPGTKITAASMPSGGVGPAGWLSAILYQLQQASGGGLSVVDEVAFTAGTSPFTPGGGFYQTTATNNSLTNGQQGMQQMTAYRAGHVNLRNSSGTEIGTSGAPVRTDPTGTTTQPVSAASLPLPSNAAQETGGNLATAATNTGNTATNVGAAGSTACSTDNGSCNGNSLLQRIAQRLSTLISSINLNGQKTMANSAPTVEASDSPLVPFSASPTSSITRPANTTTYSVNTGWCHTTSTCATVFTFSNACRVNGGQVLIPTIDLWLSDKQSLALQGIIWVFNVTPATVVNDDAAFNIATADFPNLTGSMSGFPFTMVSPQNSPSNSGVTVSGTTYPMQCAAGSTTLYAMVQVVNAYVPTSAEVLNATLHTVGVN